MRCWRAASYAAAPERFREQARLRRADPEKHDRALQAQRVRARMRNCETEARAAYEFAIESGLLEAPKGKGERQRLGYILRNVFREMEAMQ